MDRRVLGKILYGSQNYKLEGPNSDEDYRRIVMPSFRDLYYRGEATNKDGWDVRKFTSLVLGGNFNAIELLFSVKKELYSPEFEYLWYTLRAHSSDIVARRSLKFYYSVRGCFMTSLDRAVTAENEDGYLKHMARAQYFVDMLDNLRLSHFFMRDDAWRGFFTENARNIRFNCAPIDKGKLFSDMDRLSIYFDKEEPLPKTYFDEVLSSFQRLMEEKDDNN